jgi:hypothetical protein
MLHPIFQQIFDNFSNLNRLLAESARHEPKPEDKDTGQDLDDLGGDAA